MTPERISEITAWLKQEAQVPLQYPTSLIPRWRQVYYRVEPHLQTEDERRLTSAACEAYLCYEARDDPAYLRSEARAQLDAQRRAAQEVSHAAV